MREDSNILFFQYVDHNHQTLHAMRNSRIIEDSEASLLRIGTREFDQEACMTQPGSFDVLCIGLVLSACRRVDPPIWPDDLGHLFGRR